MALQLFSGRILLSSLAASLVAFLALSIAAAPARADHYLTHPAAAASPATLATQTAAQAAAARAARLFKNGAEIEIKQDANLYITSRNIPENDRLLEAYNADQANGGRVQTRLGEATAVPGLLGIANQAHRAQDPNGRDAQAYSLADAMRDAIWRKNTAARLKSLTATQSACADGSTARTPSIGLIASC